MPTSIVPVRVNVKSFEEVRLALQRFSADINRLSGTNPFSVTIAQSLTSEPGGGGVASVTQGQLIASNASDAWAALQPTTDTYALVLDSGETLGMKWAPASGISGAVTAASTLAANTIPKGDGSRGLVDSTLTLSGTTLQVNGPVDTTEIANTAGDLKIEPDVQGDVVLFGDTDVGDATSGKRLEVHRKAVEGDDYIRLYVSDARVATVEADRNLLVSSLGYVHLASANHIYLDLGDDAGTDQVQVRDSNDAAVAWVDSNGNATLTGTLKIKEAADAIADIAAYGQFWVHDDNPCTPWFTGDTGVDLQLATLTGTETFTNKTLTTPTLTTPKVDVINEETGAAGVTIDSVLLKDGEVDGVDVAAHAAAGDAHHNEAHTITSHSDVVDATGAQLETLTGTGDADALHTHATLVTGSASANDNEIARFHTNGYAVQGYTSNAPTISDTGEITINLTKKVFFYDSDVYVHCPTDGALLLNADSSVRLGIGGVQKARLHSDGAFGVGSTISQGAAHLLQVTASGTSASIAIVCYADGNTARQAQIVFRTADGTEGNESAVAATQNVGSFSFQAWTGAAWSPVAGVRADMISGVAADLYLMAGQNATKVLIHSAGDVDLKTAGARLAWDPTPANCYLKANGTDGMDTNCPAAAGWQLYIAATREVTITSDIMEFGASGGAEGSIRWGTADTLDFYSSTNERFSINPTGVGFNGVAPIARPDYTVANNATVRSYDCATDGIEELEDLVCTLIEDLISYGLLQ